jgi:NAD(P)-dependent dehydrogenase (short-subunit alcohol dehydrogenase family)
MSTHLITGAGSGIGAAIADKLHRRGDQLVLVTRSADRGEALLARWPESALIVADLAEASTTESAMADVIAGSPWPAGLSSVIHSAGVGSFGRVESALAADWGAVLAVNLVSPAVITRACLPALRAVGGTAIFINSGAGLHAGAEWSAYAASKFGLRALADSLRAEEQGSGVRVSTIYPGRTATPMQAALHAYEGTAYDPDRWVQPETIADGVLRVIVLTGQPRGQALDGALKLRVQIGELLQPVGDPGQSYLLVPTSGQQFLDATVGEVHVGCLGEGTIEQEALLLGVPLEGAHRW